MWYFELNGTQQGPEEAALILQRLRNGELSSTTLVWREGMADWQALHTVPELMQENQVMPANPVTQPGGMVQPPQGQPGVGMMPTQNGLALTSMILAILSVVLTLGCGIGAILAIPAVILGHIGRKQIREGDNMQTGEGMALSGLIIGYIVIALAVVMVGFVAIAIISESSSKGSPFP